MGATVKRDHIVDLVVGNGHPFAVNFDFVVVANHPTLGGATIHQVTAGAAVIPFELRVIAFMPFIVVLSRNILLAPEHLPKEIRRTRRQLAHLNARIGVSRAWSGCQERCIFADHLFL
jgi:hypothetical protein